MENGFKILLATDYSEAVMSAERYALQFAQSTNSKLYLTHVYEIPIGSVPSEPVEFGKARNGIRNSELNNLEQRREQLFHSLNISGNEVACECFITEGSAAKGICKRAEELGVDFIVIGSHGKSGPGSVFYGTHTWQIIKRSSVPVLVIPQDGMFNKINNIVFAAEEREGEIPALKYITQLAKVFDAEVKVFHAANHGLSRQFELKIFTEFKRMIKDNVPNENLSPRMGYYTDIVKGLNDYCESENADWLVLSPKKLSLAQKLFMPVSSFTKKMSLHARLPLFCVPDHYDLKSSKLMKYRKEKILYE